MRLKNFYDWTFNWMAFHFITSLLSLPSWPPRPSWGEAPSSCPGRWGWLSPRGLRLSHPPTAALWPCPGGQWGTYTYRFLFSTGMATLRYSSFKVKFCLILPQDSLPLAKAEHISHLARVSARCHNKFVKFNLPEWLVSKPHSDLKQFSVLFPLWWLCLHNFPGLFNLD